MSIGTNIRLYREAAGIPLKNFADRVKLSFDEMQSIENGKIPITDFLVLLRICENLNHSNGGMRLEELLEENGNSKLLPMKLPRYVRDYILEQRIKRKLTSAQLAEKLGISKPTIERCISGKYGNPRPAVLQNILSYFGITSSDLSNYYQMNFMQKDTIKEPPKKETPNLTETLFSLNDIVKLSKAVKVYDNVDMVIEQIDKAIGTLEFIKTVLTAKD